MARIRTSTLFLFLPLASVAFDASPTRTGYVENTGWIIDQHGAPRHDILFTLSRPGMNLHVRRDGFSFDLHQVDDRKAAEPSRKSIHADPLGTERGMERTGHLFHRIDVAWNNDNPVAIRTELPAHDRLSFHRTHGTYTGVRHFGRVILTDIAPGIDLVFGTTPDGGPKYDVVVRPGCDLGRLRFRYFHADEPTVDEDGTLHVEAGRFKLTERIPVSHVVGGDPLAVRMCVDHDGSVGFVAGPWPPGATLLIDPWLAWGTYMGGTGWDAAYALCANGTDLFVAGETRSLAGVATSGAHQGELLGVMDAFVARFDANGNRIWCTYFGGNGHESAFGIACSEDMVVIAGQSSSTDLAGTDGSHQPALSGSSDGFLAAFTPEGTLLWSTWHGGPMDDALHGVAMTEERIYVVGWTESATGIASDEAEQGQPGGESDALIAAFTR